MRFFNTAGSTVCEDHYCLPPLERFDLDGALSLIVQKKYFVLHAPRQSGKTTSLLSLMKYLNAGGQYRVLYFNVEAAQAAREDVERGMTPHIHSKYQGQDASFSILDCALLAGKLPVPKIRLV